MKIIVEQSALVAATARVSSVVSARNTIPILSNVMIEADRGEVWMVATDLDMEIRVGLDAEIAQPGSVTVPANTLNEIARNAPKGAEIVLSLSADDPRVKVVFGRSRYQLPMLPAGDFPVFAGPAEVTELVLPAAELATLLDRVHFAMSTDETRYYINGTYLQAVAVEGRPMLRTVATDTHRLALDETPLAAGLDFPGAILPRKTVGEFRRMLEGRSGAVRLWIGRTSIRLSIGDAVLTSKLIDGSFPDYVRVIPTAWDREITIDRALLAGAVKRVSLMSAEKTRSTKLTIDDGVMTLTVRNMEAGVAVEQVEIDDPEGGPCFEIGFNARFILDALDQTESRRVVLRFSAPASAARLDPHPAETAATGALCVLMPLRV